MENIFKIKDNGPARRIQEALEKEIRLRPKRALEEWIEKERLVVWRAVCEERMRIGKSAVPLDIVERAERCAVGHVDYTMKWALYCEDIVLDNQDREHWYI